MVWESHALRFMKTPWFSSPVTFYKSTEATFRYGKTSVFPTPFPVRLSYLPNVCLSLRESHTFGTGYGSRTRDLQNENLMS